MHVLYIVAGNSLGDEGGSCALIRIFSISGHRVSVRGWYVGGECRTGGEHSYLGLLPDEEEVCDGDRERVSTAWLDQLRSNAAMVIIATQIMLVH